MGGVVHTRENEKKPKMQSHAGKCKKKEARVDTLPKKKRWAQAVNAMLLLLLL